MRVFTIATRFGVGGAELNSQLLATRLTSDFSVETKSIFIMYANGQRPNNQSCICLLPDETNNPVKLLGAFLRLLMLIYREKPDVLIGFQPLANVFGAISVLFSKIRFIATQRNPSSSQGRAIGYIERLLGSTGLYSANIAVSKAVISSYRDYPAPYCRKLVYVYNGFPERPEKVGLTEARERLNLPKDRRIIGFLGRLAYQKYPEFLLDVISELSMPDVVLVYAGEGEELVGLKKRVADLGLADQVMFIGQIDFSKVFEFYDAIDVFLLPSRYEGFGRTLVEAMQSRVPVVASELEVTREVLASDACVIELDAEAWADRIRELISNPTSYREASEHGEERALFFSIENMIGGYHRVITEVLGVKL